MPSTKGIACARGYLSHRPLVAHRTLRHAQPQTLNSKSLAHAAILRAQAHSFRAQAHSFCAQAHFFRAQAHSFCAQAHSFRAQACPLRAQAHLCMCSHFSLRALQFQFRVGPQNMFFVHVSLVPVLGVVGEQKTKPSQHSVQVRGTGGVEC
eukprot:351582-Chlamydomonas_euryale.AAC.1